MRVFMLGAPCAGKTTLMTPRLHSEGWTNIEWLPLHLRVIDDLLARGAFAHVLDATMPVPALAATIVAILEDGAEG